MSTRRRSSSPSAPRGCASVSSCTGSSSCKATGEHPLPPVPCLPLPVPHVMRGVIDSLSLPPPPSVFKGQCLCVCVCFAGGSLAGAFSHDAPARREGLGDAHRVLCPPRCRLLWTGRGRPPPAPRRVWVRVRVWGWCRGAVGLVAAPGVSLLYLTLVCFLGSGCAR